MRSLLLLASLLIACGKGDKPPPPSSNALLAQESGPNQPSQPSGPRIAKPDDPQTIFMNQCMMCHGKEGRGDGISAGALQVKPRDYTDPKWQASITDEEIKRVIVLGGKGTGKSTAMPDNPALENKPEVLDGLVKIIRGFAKK